MAGLKLSMAVLVAMMVASTQFQSSVAQTRHVVGDAFGWNVPNSGGAAFYTTWASQQNFTVGDSLVFNFTTGVHDVAEVSQAAYGPCTKANPISTATTGPATITLTRAGTHYYFCTVGPHCQLGQKLTINVSATAAAPTTPPPTPTPTPAPVSPPTTTPTPAPAPSSTTPPPGSSPAPSSSEASPPPPPTSTPTPSGSTTPTPTGSTTPPPPNNAATSFTTVVPATFLAIGLALFY